MVKGGLQFIDFAWAALDDTDAVTIPGIYDAIEASQKAIIAERFAIGSTELGAVPLKFIVSSTDFVAFFINGITDAKISVVKVTVTDDDEVTAEVVEGAFVTEESEDQGGT